MTTKISKANGIFCPVCSSRKINKKFSDRDYLMKKEFSYYKCRKCRLLFLFPLPSQSDLNKIYNLKNNIIERKTNRMLFALNDNKNIQKLFHQFAIMVNRNRANYTETYSSSLSDRYVLDIGCGVGRFIEEMAVRGWKVIGQDVSKESIKQSKERLMKYNSKFINRPLEKLKVPKGVKVVTFWHVFEHLVNFEKILKNIAKKLPGGSTVFLECPSAGALSIKLFKNMSTNVITPEHLTFWTKESYKVLLNKYDLEILNVSYPKSFLFTSTSSAFKFFQNYINNKYISLALSLLITIISIPSYFMVPELNESIRVCAIKK